MGIIRLKNIQLYGYHGVNDFEKEKGGLFEVDVELHTDLAKACKTDDVKQTIDYDAVFKKVEQCVTQKKFDLIEALADSIANKLLSKFEVDEVTIRIRKPEAPIAGIMDTVEIEISRKIEDYA